MKKKLKIGVLFGGKSAEHEVSLISAKNVIGALDKKKYQVVPIKIGKDGEFNINKLKKVDIVFPVLHGPFGEDGSVQGLLKVLNLPFIGPGVLGSAVCMDKDISKRILKEAKIPIGKFITIKNGDKISFKKISKELDLPVFIKPANMGSSVGIHKIKNKKEFLAGIRDAFQYDTKIIIEENLTGQEIECAVLGNHREPKASILGEIVPINDFYSYAAKYTRKNGADLLIPARLSKPTAEKVRKIAVKAFQALGCEIMGRVDFFVKKNGKIFVNEINTIPGFTEISMYPKLWQESGKNLSNLLDELVCLAVARFEREQKLKTTFK